MTDIIFEAISMGVDSVISGTVVVMIVSVLHLSTQLNSYASMQETYAQSLTYYRQYSKYNNQKIVASEAVSALLYYDEGVDLFIIDAEVDDPGTAYVKLYKKDGNNVTLYSPALSYDATESEWSITPSRGDPIVLTSGESGLIPSAVYELYLAEKLDPVSTTLNYADVTGEIKADAMFKANLLEDLNKTPSEYYDGGTVTGILIRKILE